MIVYNQANYIKQAIEGVILQNLDFLIEVIISNDASTDKTHEVITAIAKDTEKIKFRYFNQMKNLGMMPNFGFALQQCKG